MARLRAGISINEALLSIDNAEARAIAALDVPQHIHTFLQAAPHWREVLVIIRLSRGSGAKMVPLLESQTRKVAQHRKRGQELATLSIASRATVLLMCGLPGLILLGSEASGVAVFEIIQTNRLAQLALILGIGLLLLCGWWMRKIVRRAQEEPEDAGFFIELCAGALGAGLGFELAVATVAQQYRDLTLGADEEVARALSWRTEIRGLGIPLAQLLLARSEELRDVQRSELDRRLNLVPIRLLLPIGLFGLPGFLCLGVIPVALAMLVSTGGSFA
ncbi:MAG: hypothetical protein WBA28_08535 [Microbacteriaceae bacterium]